MKTVTKAEWIAALRSGKFTQGRNCLEDSRGKNCCLGVLCRIAEVPTTEQPDTDGQVRFVFGAGASTIGIPKACHLLTDLDLNQRMLDSHWKEPLAARLMQMNDGDERPPKSFAEIADFLEAFGGSEATTQAGSTEDA